MREPVWWLLCIHRVFLYNIHIIFSALDGYIYTFDCSVRMCIVCVRVFVSASSPSDKREDDDDDDDGDGARKPDERAAQGAGRRRTGSRSTVKCISIPSALVHAR